MTPAATARKIKRSMLDLAEKASTQDSVIIMFSGHGQYDKDKQLGVWYPYEAEDLADELKIQWFAIGAGPSRRNMSW